jgi:hypothetical protein
MPETLAIDFDSPLEKLLIQVTIENVACFSRYMENCSVFIPVEELTASHRVPVLGQQSRDQGDVLILLAGSSTVVKTLR